MRESFIRTTTALLDDDPRTALVLADISAAAFSPVATRHPDRVLNMGIREQLMLSVAGGLAMTGLRPFVHSYATFVVDRAYEQIKLDLGHQDTAAVLVSVGASYDGSRYGYTHFSPGDVALLDTLDGWTVQVPGHPNEVAAMLHTAAKQDNRIYIRLSEQQNAAPRPVTGELELIRQSSNPRTALVLAVGPMLDPVLKATEGMDVAVAYTNTPRPFDAAGLRATQHTTVVLVEPYLAGTSSRAVSDALSDLPHRLLALGVDRADLHRYGTPADHAHWHHLDPAGIRASINAFG